MDLFQLKGFSVKYTKGGTAEGAILQADPPEDPTVYR